ncbi:heparinase II/III family protein [Arenibacter sp. S6351L]|uniref:heparinase II/III family protein n=1 Tax=Arenibacter sp. S6351L TaxID=2926407 RepID=UPI001FF4DBE4|nr:heparinase II/III family protein [Arenibacter sp. S6351L]MCK0135335.1 heparinase II/III family protein [Arenibacter sp. S6351L]
MKLFKLLMCVFLMGILSQISLYSQVTLNETNLMDAMRIEHPRMFLTSSMLSNIKQRALNRDQKIFNGIKERIDKLFEKDFKFENLLIRDGHQSRDHQIGTSASEAALLYLVFQDKRYLTLATKLLRKVVEYYKLRNVEGLNVHWYNFSRINALAAYDWLYNDLKGNERREIGRPLLEAMAYMSDHKKRSNVFRRNGGGIQSGFYGPNALPWYAGVVFYKAGVDDDLAERLLLQGYSEHIKMLESRSARAGDDGGANSGTIGYALGANPWAAFNFFHTVHSATGKDIAIDWDYVPYFINYIFWNWLPGKLEFGHGDARHLDNKLPLKLLPLHLAHVIHFYKDTHPELVSVARWMNSQLEDEVQESFPYIRLLLDSDNENNNMKLNSIETLPIARHFENMGQIFLRSGSGPNDTYGLFTSGGVGLHKHFDNNNFVIFKRGFLALDSGTRPQPGIHLSHYYCRTIAHNCITIKMPGEEMPNYWGGPSQNEENSPIPNDGGQNDEGGAEVIAFDETAYYAYIASDATNSYHEEKSNEVIRQFVFLPPDHFVIFDRVSSTRVEYQKKWMFHTSNEPNVCGNQFSSEHWEGKIFSRVIYPINYNLTKIGGLGKQFWSDGRNWPLPELTSGEWNYEGMKWLNNEDNLFGQWRMEVTPKELSKRDFFLHLIQVGDRTLEVMTDSEPIDLGNNLGVRFNSDGKDVEVTFSKTGKIGGKITVHQKGQKILEEYFTEEIKPQKGF